MWGHPHAGDPALSPRGASASPTLVLWPPEHSGVGYGQVRVQIELYPPDNLVSIDRAGVVVERAVVEEVVRPDHERAVRFTCVVDQRHVTDAPRPL